MPGLDGGRNRIRILEVLEQQQLGIAHLKDK